MATIDYKEKYEQALERARQFSEKPYLEDSAGIVEYIFPELAESEDEKIRKELIFYFQEEIPQCSIQEHADKMKEFIAWLEKQGEITNEWSEMKFNNIQTELQEMVDLKQKIEQGEQKPSEWHREDEQNLNACLGYIPDEFLRRWLTDIIHVKYDKLADKIEPKFKVGDWVICCDYEPIQIIDIKHRMYYWSNGDIRPIEMVDSNSNIHLWAIQDAKDGDVLAVEPIGRYKFPFIAIYKNYGLNFFNSYCSIGFDGKFYEADTEHVLDDIHPATKEQRETLLKAIHEAGYEWDAENKELKKIEQKTAAWSEKDTFIINRILYICNYYEKSFEHTSFVRESIKEDVNEIDNWIKSLKNRVQPQPKQEWSEEDAVMLNKLLAVVELYYDRSGNDLDKQSCISWLKSLRPQNTWRPSDEQMISLERASNSLVSTEDTVILRKLLNDLKTL